MVSSVDKRIVYVSERSISNPAGELGPRHWMCCETPCKRSREMETTGCGRCQEYALVNPVELAKVEREVETLKAAVTQHRIALRQAIAVIQSWHDLGARNISKEAQARMWQIYRDNAPEMRVILAALSFIPTKAKEVSQ